MKNDHNMLKSFNLLAIISTVLGVLILYFFWFDHASPASVSTAEIKSDSFLSTNHRKILPHEHVVCNISVISPFSGVVPEHCSEFAEDGASRLSAEQSTAADEIMATGDESLVVATTSVIESIQRGEYSSAADYVELTLACRIGLARFGYEAESAYCSSQDLYFLDNRVKDLLSMGANRRSSEAEIALAAWWEMQALVSFERFKSIENAGKSLGVVEQKVQRDQLMASFNQNMKIAVEILKSAQDYNEGAKQSLEDLQESGLIGASELISDFR